MFLVTCQAGDRAGRVSGFFQVRLSCGCDRHLQLHARRTVEAVLPTLTRRQREAPSTGDFLRSSPQHSVDEFDSELNSSKVLEVLRLILGRAAFGNQQGLLWK